jgi:3-deoxy-manno-octulosonate cytidylyltransferase (CMP-KDO synthetase)
MKIATIIPARLKSKRFPNKLLAKFNGKSILQNVIDYTKQFNFPNNNIILATEDQELIEIGLENGLEIFKTSARCGSEKAYNYYKYDDTYNYYLTVPADEPCINPNEINKTLDFENHEWLDITTFYTKFYEFNDVYSDLSCKIITNQKDYALYFSRSIIPYLKSYPLGTEVPLCDYKKHVGIFVFSNNFFHLYGDKLWDDRVSKLADIESLEQNRFLDLEFRVRLLEIKHKGFGVDMPFQISVLEKRLLS